MVVCSNCMWDSGCMVCHKCVNFDTPAIGTHLVETQKALVQEPLARVLIATAGASCSNGDHITPY